MPHHRLHGNQHLLVPLQACHHAVGRVAEPDGARVEEGGHVSEGFGGPKVLSDEEGGGHGLWLGLLW